MRQSVGVSDVAIKWRAESGVQLACQKWRSIGFTSVAIVYPSLSGVELAESCGDLLT